MKHGSDDMPVACCLTSAKHASVRKRSLRSLGLLCSKLKNSGDGYAFRVPGDGKWIGLIAEWIVAERKCCLFLAFEVAALPNMGPVIVRVIGPAGIKELLRNFLCKTDASI